MTFHSPRERGTIFKEKLAGPARLPRTKPLQRGDHGRARSTEECLRTQVYFFTDGIKAAGNGELAFFCSRAGLASAFCGIVCFLLFLRRKRSAPARGTAVFPELRKAGVESGSAECTDVVIARAEVRGGFGRKCKIAVSFRNQLREQLAFGTCRPQKVKMS